MIPKIIHQTWKTDRLPPRLAKLAGKWKELHSDWEHILWTDAMNRALIEKEYPRFLPTYDAYPHNIQRVDAVRYFILYSFGGVYIDLDFIPLKNIEPLLKDRQCVFGLDPEVTSETGPVKENISNAFMATVPEHAFFEAMIHDLKTYQPSSETGPDLVLKTTGPLAVNRVYEIFPDKEKIVLLPSPCLFPINYIEASFWPSPHLKEKTKDAYAVHLFEGRWWKEMVVHAALEEKK